MAVDELGDHGTLGVGWESGDRVDPGFNLVGQSLGGVACQRLNDDLPHTIRSGRADLLDTVEVVNRLLDPHTDLLFHLSRASPRKRHGDADAIDDGGGKKLFIQARDVIEPTDHQHHHQEVCCNRIGDEPA